MAQEKKKAIIGNFDGQKIESQIQRGDDKIVLPYYFTKVPEEVPGATLALTQQPRVVDDSGEKDSTELVDELHELLSQWLQDFVAKDQEFNLEHGEESPDVVENLTFYLQSL